jgi:hypothetical protein
MIKEDLCKMLKEKEELKERTARIYDQLVGQCVLLEELIKKEEVK